MIYVKSKRISACHQDINPQVEFQFVYQHWIFNVPLNNVFVAIKDILYISGQKNAFSLRKSLRFHDICPCFALFYTFVELSELPELRRDGPCLREKVILFRKMFLHGHQSKPKQIFPCQDINPWKMIDFLMQFHPKESVSINFSISPPKIPIPTTHLFLHNPSQFLCNFFNNGILSI